jgi:hypothetical protein
MLWVMDLLKLLNLALAFALELVMLAAFGIFAFAVLPDSWWRFVLATAQIGVAIVLWARWAAPKSATRLPMPRRALFKVVMLESGAIALALAGEPVGAAVVGAAVILNLTLAWLWGQEGV